MPGKGYRVDTDFKLRPDRRKKRAKAALVALAIIEHFLQSELEWQKQ